MAHSTLHFPHAKCMCDQHTSNTVDIMDILLYREVAKPSLNCYCSNSQATFLKRIIGISAETENELLYIKPVL